MQRTGATGATISLLLALGVACSDSSQRRTETGPAEAGGAKDVGAFKESRPAEDVSAFKEAGTLKDRGTSREAGTLKDKGIAKETGTLKDKGIAKETGTLKDKGIAKEAGPAPSIPWPSAANRPSFSGSTLTWTGPPGGGPSTVNDVQQTHVLQSSGAVTTSADGQVIEYLNIVSTGAPAVIINHNNVTIRRCRIAGGSWVIVRVSGTSGIVIEDCIVDGTGSQHYQGISAGNSGGPFKGTTIRRCNISGMENDVTDGITNGLVIDNWFHGPYGPDCDQIELYDATDNLVIQHNTFDGADPQSGAFLNAGVNLTSMWGSLTNVTIDHNRFINLPNWGICDDTSQGPYPLSFSVTNNGFYNVKYIRRGSAATVTSNSGNFTMATQDATSGALVNGTGAL